MEKLIEEATHDFQKPTLDYIIVDLKTFSAENVLRMRPMLKKLSESENFYTRPSFVSYGHKNDFGRRAKEC